MARRRMIDPNIWQSEDFAKLSTLAKLVFIGMFSHADDSGRGRAKPVYLKSIIFPYDEGMRVIDIEKALSEIGPNMSVTLYSHDENQYYQFDNWSKWQKVEKPSQSQIPPPDEAIPRTFPDDSPNVPRIVGDDSRLKEKKRKEEKGKEENNARVRAPLFIKPSVDEIRGYCKERGNGIDAQNFFDFYESKGWKVGKESMKDWKACIRTWENRMKNENPMKGGAAYGSNKSGNACADGTGEKKVYGHIL